MWQQGYYQQWPFGQPPNSNDRDWGALAQAWIQNKSMQSQNQQQDDDKTSSEANNATAPPTTTTSAANTAGQFQQQQMTWPQQPTWQGQQWTTNNWTNQHTMSGNYMQQQWPSTQNMAPPPGTVTPKIDTKVPPPLPPLPPGEPNYPAELPPGIDALDEPLATEAKPVEINPPNNNTFNQVVEPFPVESHEEESQVPEYNTPPPPPHSFQPPVQRQFDSPPNKEGQWQSNNWTPVNAQPGGWVPPESSAPPRPQWNGGRGAVPVPGGVGMQQQWVRGQMNQFHQQGQQQNMTNNNMTPAMAEQARRKALPAWIREGLERIEQEKQRRSDREQFAANDITEKHSNQEDDAKKSKFESDGGSESDAELPQEEAPPAQEEEEETVPPDVSEEESNEVQMLKVRKMLTEVLLDVTNREIASIAQSVFKKAGRAPAKQLAQSSALASIGHFGVVDGYSSDDASDDDNDDVKDEKHVDGDSDASLSEEGVQRKVEAFNKKQMLRMKLLEDGVEEPVDEATDSKKPTSARIIPADKPPSSARDDEEVNKRKPAAKKSTESRSDHKKHRSRSPSSDEKSSKIATSARSSKDERARDEKPSKKSRRKSRSRSRDRKRSRSKDRKRSRSKDRKSRKRERSVDKRDHKRKRSSSRSPRPTSVKKLDRKHSKSKRTPERRKSKSSKKSYRAGSSDRSSNSSARSDSSESDSKSRKKKKKSSKKKKKRSYKRKHQSSSSDATSSSSDSEHSDKHSKSRDEDKYRKSHGKRKSKHH